MGVTVYRNHETGQSEIHFWKVRFDFTGEEGVDFFKYEAPLKRYHETEKISDGTSKEFFKGQPIPSFAKSFSASMGADKG